MTKNDRRQEAPATPQDAQPAATADFDALIGNKLTPITEFRERAESWMKEVTGQVARLAGRSEEDDRRRQALDKRLADFEERMQSLLTLTELVSIDKNPFAGRPSAAPAAPAPAEAAPVAPSPQPAVGAAPTPASAAPPATTARPKPAPAAPVVPAQPAAAPAPMPPAATPAPAAPPSNVRRNGHPNDAHVDNPIRLSDEEGPRAAPAGHPSAAASPNRHGNGNGRADATRHRLTILEWSALLAPHLGRFDLGAFLGFYVESGWIDRETAACVRNLAQQLRGDGWRRGDNAQEAKPLTIEEIHARSILVLSHLEEAPIGTQDAAHILREARSATHGGWLTATP